MGRNLFNPFNVLSRGRLLIFIFHRVVPEPDPLLPSEPDALRFERIVSFIARWFQVITLGDAAGRLASGSLPAASACITFDDGYADNLTIAAPILQRHGVAGTFFIASGYSSGKRMWNDDVIEAVRVAPERLQVSDLGLPEQHWHNPASRAAACDALLLAMKYLRPARRAEVASELAARAGLSPSADTMMTPAQLRTLAGMGMEIGGHTVTHPILAKLSEPDAADEIGSNREQLAEWLGAAPTVFAYPNGVPGLDYSERDVRLVRAAGYEAAVSTRRGVAGPRSGVLELPRFMPWDRSIERFAIRCALALATYDS